MTTLKFKPALTAREQLVWEILASPMVNVPMMAKRWDIAPQTVRNIKKLDTKKAVQVHEKMVEAGVQAFVWDPAPRFDTETLAKIRSSTKSSSALAKEYGCAASTIRMIRTGKTYVSK